MRGGAGRRTLFDAGFAGIHWPVEFGGQGLTRPSTTRRGSPSALSPRCPPFLNMVGCVLTGSALLAFGTPQQQSEHLRPILTGERIWCQLFSEPDAGSDLASLATRAERDGDTYVVNGQKVWCSNGRVADWGILMARTDPEAPRHKGISFFLLDMPSPGCRAPTAATDERRCRVRRGVPRRRPCARGQPARSGERRVDGRHVGADQRAGLHRGLERLAASDGSTRCGRSWADSTQCNARRSPTSGSGARRCGRWASARGRSRRCWARSPSWARRSCCSTWRCSEAGPRRPGRDARVRRDPRIPERPGRADRRRNVRDPAQHHRRAHPRPPEGTPVTHAICPAIRSS